MGGYSCVTKLMEQYGRMEHFFEVDPKASSKIGNKISVMN